MGRRARIVASLLVLASTTSSAWAAKKAFSINDDLLAFPQFQIRFLGGYILQNQAQEVKHTRDSSSPDFHEYQSHSDQSTLSDTAHDTAQEQLKSPDAQAAEYEELLLNGQRYLCRIPRVEGADRNGTDGPAGMSEEDEERELARATDRGLELLREMEGRCLYYISGWWSYSFCYMNQIKQFHALPSGGAIPSYPPMEDPTAHSFILGRFTREDDDEDDTKSGKTTTDLAELQTKGGSRFLVQHLDGGDQCDLTGRNRKIEVQFHCNPQSTDRIGWIKEITTCSYLMVIYTPRLCNDVAFLPPQQDEVHTVDCREILTPEGVREWEAQRDYQMSQKLVESAQTPGLPVIGGIEVGAQRWVGSEGKRIEKGRVASAGEEKVDVIARHENGELKVLLSPEELKKHDLDLDKMEDLRKRVEVVAEGHDWTLEAVTINGEHQLRGVIDRDDDEKEEEAAATAAGGEKNAKDTHKAADQAPKEAEIPQEFAAPKETPERGRVTKDDESGDDQEDASEEMGSEEVFKDEL